jgi:hypothetical protein
VALYNIHSNIWKTLPETSSPRDATALVTLGKRVFAFDGHAGNIVEEFDYAKKTWRPVAPNALIEMVITESSVCRSSYFSIFQGDVLEFNEEKKVKRLG